jgi:hypothetical protein
MEAGTSQKFLDRFDISTNDLSALKECGHMLGEATIERVVESRWRWRVEFFAKSCRSLIQPEMASHDK